MAPRTRATGRFLGAAHGGHIAAYFPNMARRGEDTPRFRGTVHSKDRAVHSPADATRMMDNTPPRLDDPNLSNLDNLLEDISKLDTGEIEGLLQNLDDEELDTLDTYRYLKTVASKRHYPLSQEDTAAEEEDTGSLDTSSYEDTVGASRLPPVPPPQEPAALQQSSKYLLLTTFYL